MKKISKLILSIVFTVGITGCTSNHKTKAEDSLKDSDSITLKENSKNSLPSQLDFDEIEKLYSQAITLTPGECKETNYIEDDQRAGFEWPLIIHNNTGLNFDPNDYIITFIGVDEIMTDDDLLDASDITDFIKGPELKPLSSENVTIKVPAGKYFSINNPKVNLKITKEEFIRRYKALYE